MNTNYTLICTAITLNESSNPSSTPHTPEEQARRKRMMKRMAALGVAAGIGVTGAELWHNPEARAGLKNAVQSKGAWNKTKQVAKRVWKPMAIGAGADMVIEPVNTHIAQKMEDRYQKKNGSKV